MIGSEILYGATESVAEGKAFDRGPISLTVEEDMLRAIRWRGVELVRAVSYPIRDRNWGTMLLRTTAEALDLPAGTYHRRFETADGAISGEIRLEADPAGRLEIHFTCRAERDVMVNRAGFTVLHPVEGLAGQPLRVDHPDGRSETAVFPERIAPSQPIRDIRALAYRIGPAAVRATMSGEVFEMEDQRNWSDASYKTYPDYALSSAAFRRGIACLKSAC